MLSQPERDQPIFNQNRKLDRAWEKVSLSAGLFGLRVADKIHVKLHSHKERRAFLIVFITFKRTSVRVGQFNT